MPMLAGSESSSCEETRRVVVLESRERNSTIKLLLVYIIVQLLYSMHTKCRLECRSQHFVVRGGIFNIICIVTLRGPS